MSRKNFDIRPKREKKVNMKARIQAGKHQLAVNIHTGVIFPTISGVGGGELKEMSDAAMEGDIKNQIFVLAERSGSQKPSEKRK